MILPRNLTLFSKGEVLTSGEALKTIHALIQTRSDEKNSHSRESLSKKAAETWRKYEVGTFDQDRLITRAEFCLLLDALLDPFTNWPVDHRGNFGF